MQWQKSSFSGVDAEDCVELAGHQPHILLRESDAPDAVMAATRASLSALIRWQKSREGRSTSTSICRIASPSWKSPSA
ncbi:DUF397 domain-containing protein [Streptomyces sp. NPDC029674]|uniref:DUF397 domain-containing protein n=1 Tax=Streptomyces sp. NPDC029674 TaxID=3365297 RepID=UPI00384EEBDA